MQSKGSHKAETKGGVDGEAIHMVVFEERKVVMVFPDH